MLTTDMLYDRVASVCPIKRREFEEDLACGVNELCAMFGERYVKEEGGALPVKQAYFTALCSIILFFRTGDPLDRRRFLDRAKEAFITVWRERARQRRRAEISDAKND